ncbi:MAG: iron-containing alcohol dehydrogenase, partial [Promethearchaeia archaeon]
IKPAFGNQISIDYIESIGDYILFTEIEPWKILESKLKNQPKEVIFNNSMDFIELNKLYDSTQALLDPDTSIVGIGGGTICDTTKFFAWRFRDEEQKEINLILIPSIISVDAFLCSSIAVREKSRVRYMGDISPKKIIIDFDLIQKGPKELNRAGISDVISITSALGDWKLARDEINERFDHNVFQKAKNIVYDLMSEKEEIAEVSEKGITTLVNCLYEEVKLCENWGNSRPEEGSEHFLAYCLECITKARYIHGNLIGMAVLVSLLLQEEYSEFLLDDIKNFFDDIKINIAPKYQNIKLNEVALALKRIKQFTIEENLPFSIYHSNKLKLNRKKIKSVIKLLKSLNKNQ